MSKLGMKGMALLFVLLQASVSYASVVGSEGATYPIAERDALQEVKERVAQVDWSRHFQRLRKSLKSFRPENLQPLPKAKSNRTFTVDMTYTLEFDIPDGKGGILYPKGYTFNPLDYAGLQNVLVFIDGQDRNQVEWFRGSGYAKDPGVMLLLTGGSYIALSEKLQRPVFYATRQIVGRFRLQAVPSVLYQRGRLVEVREFEIEKKD
jgi:conjugal transfer pilus assembly protein TraW